MIKEGKNFKLVNEIGISYKLLHTNIDNYFAYIFSCMDLEVDNYEDRKEDFWIVLKDLDDLYFAQPISGDMLAIKLMTGLYAPVLTSTE